MNKPDYEYIVSQSNFLFKCMTGVIIFDKNLGRMSVTNGVEIVLSEIQKDTHEYLEWPPLIVIYRDSEKMFSSIQLGCKGQFLNFTFADKDPAVIMQLALELAVENRRRVIYFAQSDRLLFSRYTLDLIKRYLS